MYTDNDQNNNIPIAHQNIDGLANKIDHNAGTKNVPDSKEDTQNQTQIIKLPTDCTELKSSHQIPDLINIAKLNGRLVLSFICMYTVSKYAWLGLHHKLSQPFFKVVIGNNV